MEKEDKILYGVVIIGFIVLVQIVLIYYGGNLFRTSGLTFKELEVMIIFAFSVILKHNFALSKLTAAFLDEML